MHDGSGYADALDERHGVTTAQDPRRVSARGLSFAIGGKTLLDGVDLSLGASGITVIMGPNGAGKSTLLRLLHGLLPASAGTIHWGDRPVSDATRVRQSLVFQSPVLLRRTAAANIDFVLKARGRADPVRRDSLLAEVGLGDKARQPARLLSGGEKQRLALARALATDPEVLFLDEPAASLDPSSVIRIEDIVRRVAEAGTRVFFVTHDIAQARRLAADIVFLSRGRVAEHTAAIRFFTDPATAVARDYLEGRIVE